MDGFRSVFQVPNAAHCSDGSGNFAQADISQQSRQGGDSSFEFSTRKNSLRGSFRFPKEAVQNRRKTHEKPVIYEKCDAPEVAHQMRHKWRTVS
jgi:hypothetical protein